MPEIPFVPESAEQLRAVIDRLRTATQALRQLPACEVFQLLDSVGQLWQPGGNYFQQAESLLAGTFSSATITAALTNLSMSLNGELVEAELNRELGRADLMETWSRDQFHRGHVKGFPLGVVSQVLAGNVFLNGVVGVSQCLLTRNAALLKLSSQDTGLTALFIQSLFEADQTGVIREAVAVCAWDRTRDDLHQVLREESDAIVVWGGESALAAYPQESCQGRVIHYGPRLGIGVVLEGIEIETQLSNLAWDVALWEQKACSSPRILFVEDRDASRRFPRQVAKELSLALSKICGSIPSMPLSLDDKAEVFSLRELSDWQQQAEIFSEPRSMNHTVLLLTENPAEVPVGYRTVFLVPIATVSDIPKHLTPYRKALQTAVLLSPVTCWSECLERLVEAGITQVTAAGSAASRFLGLPHEGEFALRRLVKLVGVDLGLGPLTHPARSSEPLEALSEELTGGQ